MFDEGSGTYTRHTAPFPYIQREKKTQRVTSEISGHPLNEIPCNHLPLLILYHPRTTQTHTHTHAPHSTTHAHTQTHTHTHTNKSHWMVENKR